MGVRKLPWAHRGSGAGTTSSPSSPTEYQGGTPLSHYKFNEASGNLIDYGSVDEDLGNAGASMTWEVSSPITDSTAVSLDTWSGTGWYNSPATNSCNIGVNDFTCVLWIKFSSESIADGIIFRWNSTTTGRVMYKIDPTGELFTLQVLNDARDTTYTAAWSKASVFTPLSGTWGQIAVVCDVSEADATVYVNNSDIGAPASSTSDLNTLGSVGNLTHPTVGWEWEGALAEVWLSTGTSFTGYTP